MAARTGSRILVLAMACVLAAGCSAEEVASVGEEPAGVAFDDDLVRQLEAIGYLAGTEDTTPQTGLRVNDRDRASRGPVLYVSGHEPVALLIDGSGRELHRWSADPREFWPARVAQAIRQGMNFFRRAYLQEDGGLLVLFEGYGIVRLDRDSNVLWHRLNLAHHAAQVLPDGSIFVLTRKRRVDRRLDSRRAWMIDYVTQLGPTGEILREVSILDALLASEYAELAMKPHPQLPPRGLKTFREGDLHHTNALHLLEKDHPRVEGLRKGYLLLSSAHLSAIFALDLEAKRVTWLHRGDFLVQHEPTLLASGRILLFDNHTPRRGSRVIELDPVDGRITWQYPAVASPERFFSYCCSTSYRLPGGNTFIALTGPGRILEVTPAGETVWEYENPHRLAGAPDHVASVFDAVRLPDRPLPWLDGLQAEPGG